MTRKPAAALSCAFFALLLSGIARAEVSFLRRPVGFAEVPVRSAAAADLDGDGRVDLVTADEYGRIVVWRNEPSSTILRDWTHAQVGSVESAEFLVRTGDFDRDGAIDIVSLVSWGSLRIWRNDGTPFDGSWTSNEVGLSNWSPGLAVGDLDGDHFDDIVSLTSGIDGGGEVTLWRNAGVPFVGPWVASVAFSSSGISAIALADLDANGSPDLAVGHGYPSVSVLRNDRTPFDGTWESTEIGPTESSQITGITPADLDGDGKVDLVTVSSGDVQHFLRRNDGSPFYGSWPATSFSYWGAIEDVRAEDLDLDFDLDLVVTGAYLENDGTPFGGEWAGHSVPTGSLHQLAVADLDNDGDPDLVAAEFGWVWVLENSTLSSQSPDIAIRLPDECDGGVLDFGTFFVGGGSSRSIEIWNFGGAPLTLHEISVSDAAFRVDAGDPVIGPGGQSEATVSFASMTPGVFEAILIIASDDPDTPVITIPLRGTAIEPPIAGVSPASLAATLPTGARETQTLILSNSGGSTLDFSIEQTSEARAGLCEPLLYVQSGPILEIAAASGASRTVVSGLVSGATMMTVDPEGGLAYLLDVTPPSCEGCPHGRPRVAAVDLVSGQITTAIPDLTHPVLALAVNAAGTRLYVGDLESLSVVELATGAETFLFGPGDVSFPRAIAVNSAETVLSWISSVNLVVTHLPPQWGEPEGVYWYGRAHALSPDSTTAYVSVDGWGAGEDPECGGLIGVDLFTGHQVREMSSWNECVGPGPLVVDAAGRTAYVVDYAHGIISSIDLRTGSTAPVVTGFPAYSLGQIGAKSPPSACFGAFLSLAPVSGSVPAGGAQGIGAMFDSTGVGGGTYEAQIVIDTNDPVRPRLTVPATLTVSGPNLEPSARRLWFGRTSVGGSLERSLAVRNLGNEALTVSAVQVDDPAFSVNRPPFDLAPGEGVTFPVSFHAATAGSVRAKLTIVSSDPQEGVLELPLTAEVSCVAGLETCNGRDDDCDGAVDEDLGVTVCGVGICRRTVDSCANGAPQACVPGPPTVELCNGADDDCDGQVDEGLNWRVGGYSYVCRPWKRAVVPFE